MGGGRGQNCSKLRDVIYGRPLISLQQQQQQQRQQQRKQQHKTAFKVFAFLHFHLSFQSQMWAIREEAFAEEICLNLFRLSRRRR